MNTGGSRIVLAVALALLVGGLVLLFRLRLARGDVFPMYSSLRADPLGVRALHDGLERLPELRVERRFKRLSTLEPTPPRTLVLAGFTRDQWRDFSLDDFNALDAAVRAGGRLVIAFRAESTEDANLADDPKAKSKAKARRPAGVGDERPREKIVVADLKKLWGVELRWKNLSDDEAEASPAGPEAGPARLAWASDAYFRAMPGVEWTAIYRRGGEAVMLERTLGRGTIVVAGDSYFLSNEALQRDRPTELLARIVGPHRRVVFDESHLGVAARPGIAALARRYGLAGAFFTLLLLAALWVWRRTAPFVPPAEESPEVALTYDPTAGLEALLRRAVPAGELAAVGAAEWRRTARPGEIARVEAALAAAPKKSSAATLHNVALRALRRRRRP